MIAWTVFIDLTHVVAVIGANCPWIPRTVLNPCATNLFRHKTQR